MVFINTEAWSSMSRIVGNVDIPIQACTCVTMTGRSESLTCRAHIDHWIEEINGILHRIALAWLPLADHCKMLHP